MLHHHKSIKDCEIIFCDAKSIIRYNSRNFVLKLFIMNIFNVKTTWNNKEIAVLKLAVASVYLVLGSFFHEFVSQYYTMIIVFAAISVCFSLYLYFQKVKTNAH